MSPDRDPRERTIPALSNSILVPIALVAATAALALGTGFSEAGKPASAAKSSGYAYHDDGDEDGFAYALVEGEDATMIMTNGDDWDEIEDLKRDIDGPLLWFRVERASYVVTDDATVGRAAEALRPLRELGKKQGKLGAVQGQLGRKQGKLGAEQGRLGARQAQLSGQLQLISMRLVQAQRRGESTQSLEADRADIEQLIDEVAELQGELGRRQGELGAEQGRLGAQQGELGRQQRDASVKAREALRGIADDAIARGLAQRI